MILIFLLFQFFFVKSRDCSLSEGLKQLRCSTIGWNSRRMCGVAGSDCCFIPAEDGNQPFEHTDHKCFADLDCETSTEAFGKKVNLHEECVKAKNNTRAGWADPDVWLLEFQCMFQPDQKSCHQLKIRGEKVCCWMQDTWVWSSDKSGLCFPDVNQEDWMITGEKADLSRMVVNLHDYCESFNYTDRETRMNPNQWPEASFWVLAFWSWIVFTIFMICPFCCYCFPSILCGAFLLKWKNIKFVIRTIVFVMKSFYKYILSPILSKIREYQKNKEDRLLLKESLLGEEEEDEDDVADDEPKKQVVDETIENEEDSNEKSVFDVDEDEIM